MFDFFTRKPDWLIVGAQKAGTSALEFFLSQHPQIKCAQRKEVGFFSRDRVYSRGAGWYSRQFPRGIGFGVRLGEATPEYLYYPFAAERILQFQPRIKLIMLLRNPTERAFSAWNMFKQIHSDPVIKKQILKEYVEDANEQEKRPILNLLDEPAFPDFHSCAQKEIEAVFSGGPQALEPSFVRRGLYGVQVQRFYRLFPKDNILILESTELKAQRVATLSRVARFLGLPEFDWSRADLEDKHVRPYDSKMADSTRKLLQEFFGPHNARLYRIVGRTFDW